MPTALADDGVRLYYEETGEGTPLVFLHEFAGDHRSWEPQVRHFSRTYRCVVLAARGFPPSEVRPIRPPTARPARWPTWSTSSTPRHRPGIRHRQLHGRVYGASPRVAATRPHAGSRRGRLRIRRPPLTRRRPSARSRRRWQPRSRQRARRRCPAGTGWARPGCSSWPRTRAGTQNTSGCSRNTTRWAPRTPCAGCKKGRPSLYALREQLAASCEAPVLVIAGDEDNGVLETNLMLKRTIPRCGLAVFPKSGHVTNLEEPALFNSTVQRFLTAVEHEKWGERDPRALSTSTTGAK